MPQSGFHALAGVALARYTKPGHAAWMAGLTVGSLIPDADIVLVGIMRVAGSEGAGIHRSATHSLLVIACLSVIAGLIRLRSRVAGAVVAALALGMLGHVVLDLLFWFTGVNLLWPFSASLGWGEVNLWSWLKLPAVAGNPDLIGNELAALQPAAFALYFGYLRSRADRLHVGGWAVALAKWLARISWILFPVYVATGIVLPGGQQDIVVHASWIPLLFPAAVVLTIVLRRPLAAS
jgi:hypothetical protein